MEPRIETACNKKLIGKRLAMTLADNKTYELWKSFMPERKKIKNMLSADLISLQLYDKSFDFTNFDINATFEKWAAVEVADFDTVPEDMETITLTGGLYAVFLHQGAASEGPKTFHYIFGK